MMGTSKSFWIRRKIDEETAPVAAENGIQVEKGVGESVFFHVKNPADVDLGLAGDEMLDPVFPGEAIAFLE